MEHRSHGEQKVDVEGGEQEGLTGLKPQCPEVGWRAGGREREGEGPRQREAALRGPLDSGDFPVPVPIHTLLDS